MSLQQGMVGAEQREIIATTHHPYLQVHRFGKIGKIGKRGESSLAFRAYYLVGRLVVWFPGRKLPCMYY